MKKNIVFLVSNIYKCGGVQRVVSILTNKLMDTDMFEISILSIFKTSSNPFFELNKNINVFNLFEEPFDVRLNYFKVVKEMRRFINSQDINIFIDCGIGLTPISSLALINNKAKRIAWEHQSFFACRKFGFEWIGKQIAAKIYNCIVVLTKQDLEDYINNISKINRIEQIYNPIELKKTTINYDLKSKSIISCGSLVNIKGFDMLVDVAKIVFDKHPDWKWYIYGDGPEKDNLQDKINMYNIADKLLLKGYCNDIYKEYRHQAIYVMTSRREGLGMVLLEAQANGLPIVSFNCHCGPKEIVENNINGYLIECFNINEMAYKINELIENIDKRVEFSNNINLIGSEFNIDSIVKRWINILTKI